MKAAIPRSSLFPVPMAAAAETPSPPAMNAFRVVAAYFIVWIHTPRTDAMMTTTAWARFAVPFFVAAAVYFVVRSALKVGPKPWTQYCRSRFRRIYIPFLAWSGIYLLFKAVKLVIAPDQPNDFPGIEFLLVGSAYHLWFLPFVFLLSLAVYAVTRAIAGNRELEALAIYLAFGLGLALCVMAPSTPEATHLPDGIAYMVFALPAALCGFAISLLNAKGWSKEIAHPYTTVLALLIAVLSLFMVWQLGRSLIFENIAGVAILVAALTSFELPATRRLDKLVPLTYGIYLSHLLVIKVAETLANKMSIAEGPSLDVAIFLAAAFISTIVTAAMMKSRHLRPILG